MKPNQINNLTLNMRHYPNLLMSPSNHTSKPTPISFPVSTRFKSPPPLISLSYSSRNIYQHKKLHIYLKTTSINNKLILQHFFNFLTKTFFFHFNFFNLKLNYIQQILYLVYIVSFL